MLKTGAVVAMAGLLVAATGWWPVLVAAALMMGVGYGPSPPAGSRILAATAPPQHRTLIFSIKQAGAPAGGAFAGLILAPTASAWGWPTALILAVAIGMAAVLLIAPAREQLDTEKEPDRDISPGALFNLRKVVAPFLQLRANPVLLSVTGRAKLRRQYIAPLRRAVPVPLRPRVQLPRSPSAASRVRWLRPLWPRRLGEQRLPVSAERSSVLADIRRRSRYRPCGLMSWAIRLGRPYLRITEK